MKRFLLSVYICVLVAGQVLAQQLQLPSPSPDGLVQQMVGLTKMTVEYSRPSARGRAIFGKLVPYNEMWRTGANLCTRISFDTDVTFGGAAVPAGKYSLFTIPGENEWTIILNKNANLGGTDGYKQEEDVVRVKAKPESKDFQETFTIDFGKITANSTQLELKWDVVAVAVPIQVDVQAKVKNNIQSALAGAWQPFAAAANYYLTSNTELETAMGLIDKSLALEEQPWNCLIKSRLLAKAEKYKEAVEYAEKSMKLTAADPKIGQGTREFFNSTNEKNLAEWRPKVPAEKKKK